MTCPICRCLETKLFFEKHNNLIICAECRHIFWKDMPTEEFLNDYYANKYHEVYKNKSDKDQMEIQRSAVLYYNNHIKELIAYCNLKVETSTLVDYGCSFPYLLMEAQKFGFSELVGADVGKDVINFGKENGITMVTPQEFLNYPDNSIDVIRFAHIIEHLIEPLDLLKNVYKKLKVGGYIYITQPNFPVLSFEQSPVDVPDSNWPIHLQFFNPLSLRELIVRSGFKIQLFFSHQNTHEAAKKYISQLDVRYAAIKLIDCADKGDPFFGNMANYPVYSGENSVLYAYKI